MSSYVFCTFCFHIYIQIMVLIGELKTIYNKPRLVIYNDGMVFKFSPKTSWLVSSTSRDWLIQVLRSSSKSSPTSCSKPKLHVQAPCLSSMHKWELWILPHYDSNPVIILALMPLIMASFWYPLQLIYELEILYGHRCPPGSWTMNHVKQTVADRLCPSIASSSSI